MDSIVAQLVELVAQLPRWWAIFLLAMVPVVELRGAIPLAIAWKMEPLSAFTAAFLGNLVPVLPLLLFLGPVSQWLEEHFRPFKIFFRWVFARSSRYEAQIHKYGYWGLALFVGIPVPGTGVWLGSALAFLLKLKILPACLAMTFGVVMAGIIVLLLSLGVAELAAWGTFWAVLAVVLIGLLVFVYKRMQHK